MSSRLTSLLAALALVAGVGVSLSARTLEPGTTTCGRPEKTLDRPAEETASAREDASSGNSGGGGGNANNSAPARDEAKPAKPAKQRPAWPPPSELIA